MTIKYRFSDMEQHKESQSHPNYLCTFHEICFGMPALFAEYLHFKTSQLFLLSYQISSEKSVFAFIYVSSRVALLRLSQYQNEAIVYRCFHLFRPQILSH
ncbi:CLUMA_CG011262, isoform A [Clunio marinus]|uniref:CLUMA_CG011262, isoform A n=1 Tax=Clunio marinus TaxID=568069 RepID=A0A1J1IC70_9DIPT|nr:CLUMA_CG011262, isoform A [Clunio marinus]